MFRNILKLIVVFIIVVISIFQIIERAAAMDRKIKAPVAKRIEKNLKYHGKDYIDPYYWLKNKKDSKVIDYLKAENKYTEAFMADTRRLQKKLYNEMLGRIKEDDESVPVKIGDYFYYNRTIKGKQYEMYCRKHKTLEAEEEIFLDVNEIAKGFSYTELGLNRISPDHNILAYSVDTDGSETFTLYFKNLETGKLLKDKIKKTSYGGEWSNDGKYFFYTIQDAAHRPYKLFIHEMGTDSGKDKLVYHEPDEKFYLSVGKTLDKKYIMIELGSQVTGETLYFLADKPHDTPKVIFKRKFEVEYYVDHKDGYFYYMTNENAENFKIMKIKVEDINDIGKSETVFPHSKNVLLEGFDLYRDYEIFYYRVDGLDQIKIKSDISGKSHCVNFPEPTYTIHSSGNREYITDKLRFNYYSLVTPRTVYDYHLEEHRLEVKKVQEVPGGYNSDDFETVRLWARSRDGVKVPMSVVYRKSMKKDGTNPLFLTSYGSYGAASDPYFSANRLSLLDRGFIHVIAHIRGGDEMGRYWYENGKKLKKKNTFYDFIAVAEYLVKEKFTSPEHLVISGGSAGGLLMGAVTNMRPDLFKAVISEVPFVDVINTMMDEKLPLTVIEYDEWGNPNEQKYFDYMKSYSPYDNIDKKDYPCMLVTGGLNDPRVGYWEPAKYVAKLRTMKTDDNILLLDVKMGEGHGGASGRYDYLKDIAFQYAFWLKILYLDKE